MGEPGSQMLALDVVLQHQLFSRITGSGMALVFVFIESDLARFTNLQQKLGEYEFPLNMHVSLVRETFEDYLGAQLRELEDQHLSLAPSFVFIDPFGPTGFPMTLAERIGQHSQSEVLINSSYQRLNQFFLRILSEHARLDELFGDARWRPALRIIDSWETEVFLVPVYQRPLEEHGWRGLSFRIMNRHNKAQYHLLFGTKYYLGMLKMKEAVWSVASDGVFQYSDFSDNNQLRLFAKSLDRIYGQELADLIWQTRRGTSVSTEELIKDQTAYHATCLERHLVRALRILEYETEPHRIVGVVKSDISRRRAKSYPDGCTIRFTP